MEENPYEAPRETGAALRDYRQVCGWCAWAMLAVVVILNIAMAFIGLGG
ncbi:MAG TPA: hypothetical protein VG826_07185 [Pirellulales bacterium]|nr:hypothetical protein [Pirellulales bacterium]